jgi:hypothetical protein
MAKLTDDQVQAIVKEELSDLIQIAEVLSLNIHRSLRLLHQSIKLGEHTNDKAAFLEYMYDVARAAVVFLHSSLETALREIVRLQLKQDADISYIPLAGQPGFSSRKEKFTLNDLAKYHGQSVDEVIAESVDGYLSSLSFNNTKDITDTFARLNLPQSTLGQYYPILDEMINRRHQIVHEGDMKRDRKSFDLEPIKIEQIKVWLDTTADFCAEVMRVTVNALYLSKIVERLEQSGFEASRDQVAQWINIEVKDVFQ